MAIQTAFWVAVNTEYATITPVSARFRATAATTRNRDLTVAGAPRLVRNSEDSAVAGAPT